MPDLPTDINDSPNYTSDEHATHHNTLHGLNNQLGDFTQSGSAPGSPTVGDLWLDTATAAQSATSVTWAAFTPTWTNLTVGNGTVVARYAEQGKLIHVSVQLVWGSTTSISAGGVQFSLPVNAKTDRHQVLVANHVDSGTRTYMGSANIGSYAYTTGVLLHTEGTSGEVNSTSPFTWTTNDRMIISGTYEAA